MPYRHLTGNGQVDGEPAPLVTAVMPSSPLGESGKQRPDVQPDLGLGRGRGSGAPGPEPACSSPSCWSPAGRPQDRVSALTRVVARAGRVVPAGGGLLAAQPEGERSRDAGGRRRGRDRQRPVLHRGRGRRGAWCWTPSGCTCSVCRTCSATSATGTRARSPGCSTRRRSTSSTPATSSPTATRSPGRTGTSATSVAARPSLLEPTRLVLDVDLGDPYAAGVRDR